MQTFSMFEEIYGIKYLVQKSRFLYAACPKKVFFQHSMLRIAEGNPWFTAGMLSGEVAGASAFFGFAI